MEHGNELELEAVVRAALAAAPRASDLLLPPGRVPLALVDGALISTAGPVLTAEQTRHLALTLLGDDPRLGADLAERGACDLGYRHPDGPRFRVNVHRAINDLGLVLRRLPDAPPALAGLGLPPVVGRLAGLANGLVLVVGATGSGKSTTLAALLAAMVRTRAVHAITLEDPVEFLQSPGLGHVTQRELGTDFPSFAEGLRAALRQAPQVVLVGEVRDRETVETTLSAAETGHLVLATAHTADCAGTVERLLAFFGPQDQPLARTRLAGCLKYVVAQRLLPRVGGGQVPAVEVLAATLRVRERIAAGEAGRLGFADILEQGAPYGMATFDVAIAALFAAGTVTEETALARSTDRAATARALDTVKAGRGLAVSDITGLTLE
jgi:twitching motility protein PilT